MKLLRILCNKSLVSPAVLTATLAIATGAIAASPNAASESPTEAGETIEQIDQYLKENSPAENTLEQVTSVSQLRDVQPTDWAFQALQSLVERYGCIEGYPDRTYRGNRAMTRYEFAAGLNKCLDRIQELIAALPQGVTREDLDRLRRLQEEFAAEIASLRGRVDNLEARVTKVEAQQFSTTTKLKGEAVFMVADIVRGQNAFGRNIDSQTIFVDRVRLNFESSFFGEDELKVRLQAGNMSAYSANSTFTPQGDFYIDAGTYGTSNNNSVEIDELSYLFPIGKHTQVLLAANGTGSDGLASTFNIFDGDGATGAISRFGTRNPIYYLADGTGIGIKHEFSDSLAISVDYRASSGSANNPSQKNGLFNGAYGTLAQLTFKPSPNFGIGLTYVNSYNTDLGTGSRVANLRSTLASDISNPLYGNGNSLAGSDLPTSSNSYGAEFSWKLASNFILGGWAGYTKTRTLSTLNGQLNRGSLDIFNGAVTLGFPDLGKKGNLGGIIVGVEPIADASSRLSSDLQRLGVARTGDNNDTSWHIEGFYQIQLTDNIAITPGVIWITAPDHNSNNNDIVIGVIRTTFSF